MTVWARICLPSWVWPVPIYRVRLYAKSVLVTRPEADTCSAIISASAGFALVYSSNRRPAVKPPTGLRSEPATVACGQHRLCAITDPEACVDAMEMGTDGALRQIEFQRDLFGDLSLSQRADDLELALRQGAALIGIVPRSDRICGYSLPQSCGRRCGSR